MKTNTITMKSTVKCLVPGLVFALGLSAGAQITFEPAQGYTLGALSPGTSANAPFSGQQGWSESTSSDPGAMLATTSSGAYVGGQALGATTSAYIGLNQGYSLGSQFSFDLYTGDNDKGGVGAGYVGTLAGGNFQQATAPLYVGLAAGSGAPVFAVRSAGLGTTFSTGVASTMDNWYQYNVTLNDASQSVDFSVFDLTTDSAVSFAGASGNLSAGPDYLVDLSSSQYGAGYDSATSTGVFARATATSGAGNSILIDNIVATPEPGTLSLAGVGVLCILIHQYRRHVKSSLR